jgi:septal ring factor EnvC (AmiA/AmiB activator)
MSALDTAKEIGRIASTASLGKDVIDLLEKKVALLTEQVTALETENLNLRQKVYDLEQELERLRPKQDRFEKDAERILESLFDLSDDEGIPVEVVGQALGISKSMAKYHCNTLMGADVVHPSGFGVILAPKGIEYCVRVLGKK